MFVYRIVVIYWYAHLEGGAGGIAVGVVKVVYRLFYVFAVGLVVEFYLLQKDAKANLGGTEVELARRLTTDTVVGHTHYHTVRLPRDVYVDFAAFRLVADTVLYLLSMNAGIRNIKQIGE